MQTLKYNKKLMRIINIIVTVALIVDGTFFGWPEVFRNPYFFPHIEKANAAIALQHNWYFGVDDPLSNVLKVRPNSLQDTSISIKVGSARGSGTDTVLRLQVENTGTYTIGDRISLAVTDCTGVALKTCAGRSLGSDPATQFVLLDVQGGTTTGLFRFREADNANFIGGNEIPLVVGVTDHNPPKGIMVEGDLSSASSTSNITTVAYQSTDYSFEYYGSAPTVEKEYMFGQVWNGVLTGWSGMHGNVGAQLSVLPANWTGSLIVQAGSMITSGTTATATMLFADDVGDSSSTTFRYALYEEGPWTTYPGCGGIRDTSGSNYGHADFLDSYGNSIHKRWCGISGLTASSTYFIQYEHVDTDGVAGNAIRAMGPYFTQFGKGSGHMHLNSVSSTADLTGEDVGEVFEMDAAGATPVNAFAASDGEYSIQRVSTLKHRMHTTSNIALHTTYGVSRVEVRYIYGTRGSETPKINLWIGAPATPSPEVTCTASGGTGWEKVTELPDVSAGFMPEVVTTTLSQNYTMADLIDADFCAFNNRSGGNAGNDIVTFDTLVLFPIYIPPTSGDGSPTTTTNVATFVSSTGAQLNAEYNSQGMSAKMYFEYGINESYGSYSSSTAGASGEFVFNSMSNTHVPTEFTYYARITGLTAGVTYHYRSCIKSPPTATAVCGGDMTFTTSASHPDYTLNAYRWYTDSDALDVTDAWGNTNIAQNTPITVLPYNNLAPTSTTELRLRTNLTVAGEDLPANNVHSLKLQFKQGTDGNCTTGSWTDVGAQASTTFAWRFANSSVQSPNLATSRLSPVSDVMQLYVTTTPALPNPNSATIGQTIEYDWHIMNNNATSTARYSFRIVYHDDDVISGFTNCPTLTTGPDMPTFMRHGNSLTDGLETGFYWTD
ncbi:MAG: hypothetical protein Q8O88_06160 [bacterium]|nr:hypothetical protein [bacterium]